MSERLIEEQEHKLLGKIEGAMVLSAIGDALGWPTELGRYPRTVPRRHGKPYLEEFIGWEKVVGGRFWGYKEKINPGSYSDDTQLALCVARCLTDKGDFEADKFAYLELPLWLHYERGGGRSVKTAARTITRSKKEWWSNFYKVGQLTYRNAGANGAAMRVLPIGLVNVGRSDRLYRDAFLNAIVTHGHPRAILGSILYASLAAYLVSASTSSRTEVLQYAKNVIMDFSKHLVQDELLGQWIREWDREPLNQASFREHFQRVRKETAEYLDNMKGFLSQPDREYYKYTGALGGALRGSGISTVCVAIYLFLKYRDSPPKAVLSAANMIGSDADTVASFVGGLIGSYHGMAAVPIRWLNDLQDRDYMLKIASLLFRISTGHVRENCSPSGRLPKEEALLRILAWEIGLREMFWDALAVGERLVHPALGSGTIRRKEIAPTMKGGFQVKLVDVEFDCGQSCTFHSRVRADGEVSESLLNDALMGISPCQRKLF